MGPSDAEASQRVETMRQVKWEAGRTAASIVVAAYTLGVAACGGSSTNESSAEVHGHLSAAPASVAALSSRASCEQLLTERRTQLLFQVSERAEQARRFEAPEDSGIFNDDAASAFEVSAAPAAASKASVPNGGTEGSSAPSAAARSIERGDIVKTDVDLIYLLHGSELLVLGAEPAASTELLATAPIEGQPLELLVSNRRIVVFSTVSGPPRGSGDERSSYTKLTVLELGRGRLDVLREAYVEGVYNSARREGDVVRALLKHSPKPELDSPNVSYADVFGHPRTQADIDLQVDLWERLSIESIEGSSIEDHVPSIVERVGGELVRQSPSCDDYLLPGGVLVQPGSTTVLTIDLGMASAPLANLTVLADVGAFNAGPDAIILTQWDYDDSDGTPPTVVTNLHRLSLDERTSYETTGRVSGSILNIDESNGVVRVLTIQNRYIEDPDAAGGYVYAGPSIRVVTLSSDTLTELGHSADLTTDEYVINSKFVGDRAYLVTAQQQTTGVAIVDLSDPTAPAVVGRVHTTTRIFGIYPVSTSTLLGVGEGADPTVGVQNVALQLMDVSDPSAPSVAHELVFSEPGYTAALNGPDELGINSSRNAIALPFQSYMTGATSLEAYRVSLSAGFSHLGGVVPPLSDPTLHECLEILGYPADPESLAQLELDPIFASSLLKSCRSYETDDVRRGLFRGKALFAIGNRRMTAYSLDALTEPPLSQVVLDP